MSDKRFVVGQEVWFEPRDTRDKGRYITITKVGKKLYHTSWGVTFDIETNFRGTYPDGELFINEQEAINHKKAQDMWIKLKYNLFYLHPTLEQMKAIYNILGLEEQSDE